MNYHRKRLKPEKFNNYLTKIGAKKAKLSPSPGSATVGAIINRPQKHNRIGDYKSSDLDKAALINTRMSVRTVGQAFMLAANKDMRSFVVASSVINIATPGTSCHPLRSRRGPTGVCCASSSQAPYLPKNERMAQIYPCRFGIYPCRFGIYPCLQEPLI